MRISTRYGFLTGAVCVAFLYCSILSHGAEWARACGGSGLNSFKSLDKTDDGSFIVAGLGWDSIGIQRPTVMKVDASGAVDWQYWQMGPNSETANCIRRTSDGGYIIAGRATSWEPNGDVWVLKLNSTGTVVWEKAFGGTDAEYGLDVEEATIGGYYVAGMTSLPGGYDLWICRLDGAGNEVWQETFGGEYDDRAQALAATFDGGVIIAGRTESFSAGMADVWLLKLDSEGHNQWQMTYGAAGEERAYGIRQTADGGYIFVGMTDSFSTDPDAWVVKVDESGNIQWQKRYATDGFDALDRIIATSDGGYIASGESEGDAYALKISSAGHVIWQKRYGGSGRDETLDVVEATDGGYVLAGETDSFRAGGLDGFLLKVDTNGDIPYCSIVQNGRAVEYDTPAGSAEQVTEPLSKLPSYDTSSSTEKASLVSSIICARAQLDLTGLWRRLAVSSSGRLRGTFTCTNDGSHGCSDFLVKIYLSKSPAVGKGAKLIQTKKVTSLDAGKSIDIKVTGKKGTRDKYIVAVIDPDNKIAEDNESNNVIAKGL